MIPSFEVREFLIKKAGLRHIPLNNFGCSFANEKTVIGVTVNSISIKKWNEKSGDFETTLSLRGEVDKMSEKAWEGALCVAGIELQPESRVHPVFEAIINKFSHPLQPAI